MARQRTRVEILALVFIGALFLVLTAFLVPLAPQDIDSNFCPQRPLIDPLNKHNLRSSADFLHKAYASKSLELLQGAVKIPTVVYDDMVSLDDGRFGVFDELHQYLLAKFPLAAKHAQRVNKYGLLYTFGPSSGQGTLLISHQDVVPAPAVEQWTYPPFSAHYDGKYVFGRGVSDGKNALVGILEAVESLLEQEWTPQTPLVLAFGFDKELGGSLGAAELAEAIYATYGTKSFKVVLDEGQGLEEVYGSMVAMAGVEEKGMIDVKIDVQTHGGHSSAPPKHTGIGIMARIIRKLEKHAHDSMLPDDNPTLQFFRCLAEHSETMPKEDRRIVLDPVKRRQRLKFIKQSKWANTIRTTQAVDYIEGGVKINALPELTTALINNHISVDSSYASVIDRFEHFILSIAEQYDYEVFSDNDRLKLGSTGNISLSTFNRHNPSPVTPYYGEMWDTFSGTIRHVFEKIAKVPGNPHAKDVVVAPCILESSTDTHYYWDLTRSVYRFSPCYSHESLDRHTSNERLTLRSHLLAVAWYYEFIINTTA